MCLACNESQFSFCGSIVDFEILVLSLVYVMRLKRRQIMVIKDAVRIECNVFSTILYLNDVYFTPLRAGVAACSAC